MFTCKSRISSTPNTHIHPTNEQGAWRHGSKQNLNNYFRQLDRRVCTLRTQTTYYFHFAAHAHAHALTQTQTRACARPHAHSHVRAHPHARTRAHTHAISHCLHTRRETWGPKESSNPLLAIQTHILANAHVNVENHMHIQMTRTGKRTPEWLGREPVRPIVSCPANRERIRVCAYTHMHTQDKSKEARHADLLLKDGCVDTSKLSQSSTHNS